MSETNTSTAEAIFRAHGGQMRMGEALVTELSVNGKKWAA